MSRLENIKDNISKLAHFNAKLAEALVKIDTNFIRHHFEFCNTEKNELNLVYKKKFKTYFIHDQKGAVAESISWLASIRPQCQVLYVFGAGLGYSFLTIKKWLEQNTQLHLVYIEPLLPALFHLFQTEIGSKMVQHPRVHFFHFKNRFDLKKLIHHLSAEFSLLKCQVIISPFYRHYFPKMASWSEKTILREQEMISTMILESRDSKNHFFRNFTTLAPHLNGRYNGSMLLNAFHNIPCIIVGAGPSLKKNIELLKTLPDKALIIGGSSALSALTQQGFIPHMGNYFDPYQRVYDRFLTNTAFELPILHCARTFSEVARWIHGPQVYLKGASSTPVVHWLEQLQGFSGVQFQDLISVTTLNTSFAQFLGCNPIIYIGVDLAFTDQKNYAEGVVQNVKINPIDSQNESALFEFNKKQYAKDIYGQTIETRAGWIMEAEGLSELAKSTPNIRFFNGTEGGIAIPGIPNLPLKEIASNYLNHSYPIAEMVHSTLATFHISKKGIEKKAIGAMKEFLQSLNRCSKFYQATVKALELQLKQNKKGTLNELHCEFLIENMTLIGYEIAYQYLLRRFHQPIDILKIKHKHLQRSLSQDAPKPLIHEIKLVDMMSRFKEYQQVCDEFRVILKHNLEQHASSQW